MTQEQLAEKSGASQARISALERRNSKASELLFAIAAALEINPEWLLTGEGDSWFEGKPLASTPAEEMYQRYLRAHEASRQAIDILLSEKALQVRKSPVHAATQE